MLWKHYIISTEHINKTWQKQKTKSSLHCKLNREHSRHKQTIQYFFHLQNLEVPKLTKNNFTTELECIYLPATLPSKVVQIGTNAKFHWLEYILSLPSRNPYSSLLPCKVCLSIHMHQFHQYWYQIKTTLGKLNHKTKIP